MTSAATLPTHGMIPVSVMTLSVRVCGTMESFAFGLPRAVMVRTALPLRCRAVAEYKVAHHKMHARHGRAYTGDPDVFPRGSRDGLPKRPAVWKFL